MANSQTHRLGFDIGGTFTDAVVIDPTSGKRNIAKTLTTSSDPATGAMSALSAALDGAGVSLNSVALAVHGTTIVSNAILQHHGSKAALITTKGFRDVLRIGRELRYDVYDLTAAFPDRLIGHDMTFEVPERTLANGTIFEPLDEAAALELLDEIERSGAEAIAVCFLHSYRNPLNEMRLGELIEERLPEVPYSLSSQVVPEFREYERMSTTAANAYTQPLVKQYLSHLGTDLEAQGYERDLYVMMSTGGIATADTAADFPVRMVESGPAAGALATGYYGNQIGEEHLLSFDMGGTTAKVCVIDHGTPTRTKYFEVARVERFILGSGLPIRSPVIDLIEIGAGGGSIASVNNLGLLQVGPESAEADPGPACYDQGGTSPTVTDADLALGYLDPAYFAGGSMRLRSDLAEGAIRDHVGDTLDMDSTEAAWGIYQIVNENMASAARVHFAEKGRDPRQYALFAFGGAGPVHAAAVARRLRIERIIIPAGAGVLAAFGFMTAPVSFDFIRTHITRLDRASWDELNAIYEDMEDRGRDVLAEAGVPEDEQQFVRTADMRYAGQLYEITVPVPDGELNSTSRTRMEEFFHMTYHDLYGRHSAEAPIEALNWRLLATGPTPDIPLERATNGSGEDGPEMAKKGTRQAYFGDHAGWTETAVFDRYQLRPGHSADGPAIIEERESTVIVPPNAEFGVDEFQNIRIVLDL